MVTARIAGFKPGTSPPPVKIPITPFLPLVAINNSYPPNGENLIKHEMSEALL
jgi:hypothetical protein